MANPTTNYGWPMPTSTDLVTDLPADFAAFGQPVDTTLKALNPETTLGDISYRSATSNTNTRLGIGTNGQVLAVSGGVPAWTTTADVTPLTTKGDLFTFDTADARLGVGTNGQTLVADSSTATGLKWAAASSGALTLVQRTSFSSVASQTFDNVFTTTYENYIVYFNMMTASTNADDPLVYLRYGSPAGDLTGTGYYNRIKMTTAGATVTGSAYTGANFIQLADNTGGSNDRAAGWMNFMDVGNNANKGNFTAQYTDCNSGESAWLSGAISSGSGNNKIVTGFRVQSSSSTITGTVSIYGLAKS